MTNPPLVVFSHLRWDWVWQRPQHILSRIARTRRVIVVEEPLTGGDTESVEHEVHADVEILRLRVPGEGHLGFDDPRSSAYVEAVASLIEGERPIVWLYTPLAYEHGCALDPCVLVYDIMDDLASFKNAAPLLSARRSQALARADLVFTGGRSLHRAATESRPVDTYLFASGVELEHFATCAELRKGQATRSRPVAGYVGVVDERLDLPLLAELAGLLPEWDIAVVGPVAKIDPADLPSAPNLTYHGAVPYSGLPGVMAGFDVALMPFALNEATRSISPTKTLEYLAAGLPVVSTRVPDVVADYGHTVDLQDDGAGFADACKRVLEHSWAERADRARPLLDWHHWDSIAERMQALMLLKLSIGVEAVA
jgi:glycosyltransferase involved in cell wall biosynthesis